MPLSALQGLRIKLASLGVLASACALLLALFCTSGCAPAQQQSSAVVTGVIGAMESEVNTIKASMDGVKETTVADMTFVEGAIHGKQVVVVQCGMGKVNAGICAQTLIDNFGVSRIINTGVAGSLTKDLGINDFVVSVDAVQHDFDVTSIGFERGEIPYTGMVAFPADEVLRALAMEAVKSAAPNSKVLEGRVCTGDQFIDTQEEISTITSNFGGMCAEMEGGAIAQVCYLYDTPYVIIRAISDDSDGASFDAFQEEAAAECAYATLEMIEKL